MYDESMACFPLSAFNTVSKANEDHLIFSISTTASFTLSQRVSLAAITPQWRWSYATTRLQEACSDSDRTMKSARLSSNLAVCSNVVDWVIITPACRCPSDWDGCLAVLRIWYRCKIVSPPISQWFWIVADGWLSLINFFTRYEIAERPDWVVPNSSLQNTARSTSTESLEPGFIRGHETYNAEYSLAACLPPIVTYKTGAPKFSPLGSDRSCYFCSPIQSDLMKSKAAVCDPKSKSAAAWRWDSPANYSV